MRKTSTQTNYMTLSDSGENKNKCPICNGTGWKIINDGGQGLAVECECGLIQKEIAESRMSFANIPSTFKDVRIANFDETLYSCENKDKVKVAIKCVNHWLNNFDELKEQGMGLYLYSKTKGSGKTRMAVSIANELLLANKVQVKFCTSLQILNEIKSSWERQNEYSESKLLDFLSTSEVLIIDDFGAEQSEKPWINERFYQIINNRYVAKKITIFTSNDRLDLIRYDDRITNRIKERTFQIPFPEESIRDVIAKKNTEKLVREIRKEK